MIVLGGLYVVFLAVMMGMWLGLSFLILDYFITFYEETEGRERSFIESLRIIMPPCIVFSGLVGIIASPCGLIGGFEAWREKFFGTKN